MARFVNDAKHGNCLMRKVVINSEPHLCLFAKTTIRVDDQLFYDYGDDPAKLFWRDKVI